MPLVPTDLPEALRNSAIRSDNLRPIRKDDTTLTDWQTFWLVMGVFACGMVAGFAFAAAVLV